MEATWRFELTVEQVLQVNIRLSEGGAAGVARSLADGLRAIGIRSPFAYGYGKRGGHSPIEEAYHGIKVTPAAIAALNRTSYSLRGRETSFTGPGWERLLKAIGESDVIHLHAIHSYFAPLDRLFDAIRQARKPVVWTMHDQWAMTGRCAQPGGCRLWETGCPSCPNLAAYPPARVDHAGEQWPLRRNQIKMLQDSVPTRLIACADWLAEESQIAGLGAVGVVKNSVDPEFWKAIQTETSTRARARGSNLFMCRDLRDANKVNWQFLRRVAQLPTGTLTIVGDNPQAVPQNVSHRGSISNRTELARLLLENERLIFTSTVDYFPLTIAEALTAGMEVLALDSRAAREFQRHPSLHIFPDEDSILGALLKPVTHPIENKSTNASFFDPARMVNEYLQVYRDVVEK